MRDLFEDDDIELEDAVEVMPENSIPKTAFTTEKYEKEIGKSQKKTFLKVIETGEILTIFDYGDLLMMCNEKGDRIGEMSFEPNGELRTVCRIDSNYRNLKIGDFLIKTAIQKYGCWWLNCNGDRAYKIYRKYGLLPIYNGVTSPDKKVNFEKNFKDTISGKLSVYIACTMCDKKHLSKFGLKWSKELEEFVKFMDANYKGENFFGDSKKTYRYEFVEDTIEVIPSDKEETEVWGDFTTLKVKETDEELYVFDKPDEIEVCKKNGNSFKRIAHIKITDGYIHDFRIEDEEYKGYKLGNYLFKRAVEDYNGWKLDCGGTIAYKLYRKYDFVPIAPRQIGISKALATIYKRDMKICLEEQKDVSRIIPMIRKDHLSDIGLEWDDLLKKFTEYVDARYNGVYDSGKYVFEKVSE